MFHIKIFIQIKQGPAEFKLYKVSKKHHKHQENHQNITRTVYICKSSSDRPLLKFQSRHKENRGKKNIKFTCECRQILINWMSFLCNQLQLYSSISPTNLLVLYLLFAFSRNFIQRMGYIQKLAITDKMRLKHIKIFNELKIIYSPSQNGKVHKGNVNHNFISKQND